MQQEIEQAIVQSEGSLSKTFIFIAACVTVLLIIYRSHRLPSYVFRKCLHIVAFSLVCFIIASAQSWKVVSIAALILTVLIYPLLAFFEGKEYFTRFFVEKEPGEIKLSFVLLFLMLAGVNFLGWGLFGKKELAICSILMWGVGDAAAALVGIPFGSHKARLKIAGKELTDGKKSWEGSGAMALAAFICGLIVLTGSGWALQKAILLALPGALAASISELLSPSEYDTITVPFAVLLTLLIFA